MALMSQLSPITPIKWCPLYPESQFLAEKETETLESRVAFQSFENTFSYQKSLKYTTS